MIFFFSGKYMTSENMKTLDPMALFCFFVGWWIRIAYKGSIFSFTSANQPVVRWWNNATWKSTRPAGNIEEAIRSDPTISYVGCFTSSNL